MRRSFLLSLALSACAVMAQAADEKPADETAKDEKTGEKTLKDQLQDIQKAHRENEQELLKKFQAAETVEEKNKIRDEFMSGDPFVGQALELVKQEPASDVALQALQFAIQAGQQSPKKGEAIDLLIEHHIDSPVIAQLVPALAQSTKPDDVKLLDRIAEKSSSKDVKGMIAYSKAESLYNRADRGTKDAEEKKELFAKAESLFETVADEYEGVKMGRRDLAAASERWLFQLRNLQVGMKAPDVEIENLEGEQEKLSDYAGKVVVLDIWATWCGPCRAMIPHEREMVERLKDKPFALISVSADAEKKTLEDFLEEEKMPWNHWYNGASGGMVEKWNVRYFPTIYVIDAEGVIRHKDVRGDAMEEAVNELLKETEGD